MSSESLTPKNEPTDRPDPAHTAGGTSGDGLATDGLATREPAGTVSESAGRPAPGPVSEPEERRHATRTGMVWTATIVALVLLVLLIIFIAQNQSSVQLRYFAAEGTVSLGLALLAAAVAGGFLVASAGAARIIALRAQASRQRRARNKQNR
jgi:putative membrane protein